MKIVTYHYTEQDRIDQANGLHVDLTDKVSYQSINDDGVITSIFSLEVGCITVYFDYCGENVAAHAENLSQCDAVETDYLEFGDCSGGGGYTGMSDPSGSSNTQTGGNQGGGSGISTSPIEPPEPPTDAEVVESCIGQISATTNTTNPSFTPAMITWLHADDTRASVLKEMKDYLAANGGCNLENQQLIIDAIQAILDGEVDTLEEYLSPCRELTNIEEDTYIKNQLSALTPIAANNNVEVEVGVFFTDNNTAWGATSVVGTATNPSVSFAMLPGTALDIFVHTHYKGLLSVFSPGDLQACHQILSNGFSANGTDLLFILITNSGTKYAFKVTDLDKFNAIAQEHFLTTENLNQFGADYFDEIDAENNNDRNELAFLKMMEKLDLGISLFKANSDFSEWKELSLNANQDDVQEDDCN